jgi:hypothetical protein
MLRLREMVSIVTALTVWSSVPTEAGSVQIHHSESEIEAANIALYEREVGLRDEHPARFDHKHPLLGQLLSNQAVYEHLLQKFESHPKRFEHYHPFLWRVLDGDWLYHEKHPFEPPISPPPVDIPPIKENGRGDPGNPGKNGVPVSGGGPDVASVPEPSTGVLMLSALVAGVLGAVSRRAISHFRRPT